jgi:hypothetical protein
MVDFLIIGAQKGGSTWLYNNLQGHPNVYTPKEEIHFFSSDANHAKGTPWYHGHFPSSKGNRIYGEKTPEYLTVIPTKNKKTSTETHNRILEYNRHMKLLVVLREPVARLRSAITHMYRTTGSHPGYLRMILFWEIKRKMRRHLAFSRTDFTIKTLQNTSGYSRGNRSKYYSSRVI